MILEHLRKSLFFIGVGLFLISIILLLGSLLFPNTYFVIALSNTFIQPLVWGLFLIILSFILKREKKKKGTFIIKAIYVALLVPLINFTITFPFPDAIRDIQAVTTSDLYVVEGTIVDTYIQRKSGSSISGNRSDSYYKYITLNNERRDKFSIMVKHKEDYVLKLEKYYQITALPHSRTVLKYELK